MNRQVVIDWRTVLPLDGTWWRDSIDYVISDLQEEHGRVLRPASSSEELVDVLFVAYMAVDHARIVGEGLLSRRLSTQGPSVGTLVLVACDLGQQDAEVNFEGVRELLISQGADFGSDQRVLLSGTVELLQDQARDCISSAIRRAKLMNYFDEDPHALPEDSSMDPGSSLLRGEYL